MGGVRSNDVPPTYAPFRCPIIYAQLVAHVPVPRIFYAAPNAAEQLGLDPAFASRITHAADSYQQSDEYTREHWEQDRAWLIENLGAAFGAEPALV